MLHTDLTFSDYPLFAIDDVVQQASSLTASSTDANHPVSLLTNGLTFDYWRSKQVLQLAGGGGGDSPDSPAPSSTTATVRITVQLPTALPVTYGAIVGHNFEGAVCSWESSNNGIDWTTQNVFTAGEGTIDLSVWSEVEAIFWRFSVTLTQEVGVSYARISVLRLGEHFLAQRRIGVGHSPLPLSRDTTYINWNAERGHSLDRAIVRSALTGKVALQNLTPEWYRSTFDEFARKARTRWFAFAWRPDTYPTDLVWVATTEDIRPQNQRANRMMNVSFGVRGYQQDEDEESEPVTYTTPLYPLKVIERNEAYGVALDAISRMRQPSDESEAFGAIPSVSLVQVIFPPVTYSSAEETEAIGATPAIDLVQVIFPPVTYSLEEEAEAIGASVSGILLERVIVEYNNAEPEESEALGAAVSAISLVQP